MNRYVPTLQDYVSGMPFDLDHLCDSKGTLQIRLLGATGEKLSLAFTAYLAYRKTDEGDAMVTLAEVKASAVPGQGFYKVEDSEFVRWFLAQSYGVRNPNSVTHFAVHTIDDVIDVLSLEAPEVMAGERGAR